jgi:hypothetical protein
MKIKPPLYFEKSRPPRWAAMEGGCELQLCPRRKKGAGGIYRKINHRWFVM